MQRPRRRRQGGGVGAQEHELPREGEPAHRPDPKRRLLAGQRGIPALHVQTAADLDPQWFKPYSTVGLTAGTSTLDTTIEEVYGALLRIGESAGRD